MYIAPKLQYQYCFFDKKRNNVFKYWSFQLACAKALKKKAGACYTNATN